MKKWQTLNSHYLIRESWVTVRQDQVITDKGIYIPDYFVLEYPTWVNVIAITEDGLFIIEEQYRHGLDTICFEIPAGICAPYEKPIETAKRELLEETGFGDGYWQEYDIYAPNPNSMNNNCHTFLAEGVRKLCESKQEITESITIHLCSLDKIKRMLIENKIQEGVMAAPLWRYLYEKK